MQEFKNLHEQDKPLLLANVWDVSSAECAEKAGYHAIGTSSAAIASVLGYEDGEQMPFDEMAYLVGRIAAVTSLPLSVDIEAGYSRDPKVIAEYIKQLSKLGVLGVNIEDSVMGETRTLVDREDFSELIYSLKIQLAKLGIEVFINVRSDVFLLGLADARDEAILRAKSYQGVGANGLFFPCVTNEEDISAIVEATSLPVNVMAMPDLPDTKVLAGLGVKRVSTGSFSHDSIYARLTNLLVEIKNKESLEPLFT